MALTYKDAGVDIDAGARLVERIKPLAAATRRPEVLSGLGGFAGLCRLPERYRDPVLVSGTDGVGTKLKTAFASGRHDSVGMDLVAMCTNDIAVTGAEPLFFLDYFATGQLSVEVGEAVVAGIAAGCRQAGCALLGGETAELPGMYPPGEYDLAGFAVGVVERDELERQREMAAGHAVIGLASSGLHANGHSLARRVILETLGHGLDDAPAGLGGASVADVLLEPTRIYVAALRAIADAGARIAGAAHITGGGLIENPPRMLPEGADLAIELDRSAWSAPPVFQLIASAGVEPHEMLRTFNMGLGMLVVVPPSDVDTALMAARSAGEAAAVVGEIRPQTGDPVVFV